jgi:hypothetical protein
MPIARNVLDFATHVRQDNPSGRGRPWKIRTLMLKVYHRQVRRVTQDMRLKLSYYFDNYGIEYDHLLDEGFNTTRLWNTKR